MTSGSRAWLAAAVIAAVAAAAAARAGERLDARMPDGSSPPRECLFHRGTIVPRLAIGVRRVTDPQPLREALQLELRPLPAESAAPVTRRPLYQPLFVYAEHRAGDGTEWFLLGSDYAVSEVANLRGALGWVDGRELHLMTSRYAYHFKNPVRKDPVHLYQNEADAYAALSSQSQRPPQRRPDLALVAERLEEDHWDPLAPGAIPPFVEVPRLDSAGLPDTTLTFPLAADNRLIHLGAVVGGPVDEALLAEKQKQTQEKVGVEVLFVIDDTRSMEKFFGQVADFIQVNLVGGGDANLKVAVAWYNDREDDSKAAAQQPYTVGPLGVIAPQQVVQEVRAHKSKTIKGDGAQARELMCEGLEAAIRAANFTAGAHAMAFVIGDCGDRSPEKTRTQRIEVISQDIAAKQIQVAFIQVGGAQEANADATDEKPDTSFTDHAGEIGAAVQAKGGPAVTIAKSDAKTLEATIRKLQDEMDARRRRLQREIEEIESRNRYSQPGPVMERRFEEAGIARRDFDARHMQFFTPACGWLYHPLNPDGDPQLRELVFISHPEANALVVMLAAVKDQVLKQSRIDGAAALNTLAKQLDQHPRAAEAARACWEAIPAEERSVGTFLRDAMGLRVRNPALYQRQDFKKLPATQKVGEMLDQSKNWLVNEKGPKAERVWYDSWLVLP